MITGYEYTIDSSPRYRILETSRDPISGKIWHKLLQNTKATHLITTSKAYYQWDIIEEITGKKFIWVTDQLLTVLHVQGLEPGY